MTHPLPQDSDGFSLVSWRFWPSPWLRWLLPVVLEGEADGDGWRRRLEGFVGLKVGGRKFWLSTDCLIGAAMLLGSTHGKEEKT